MFHRHNIAFNGSMSKAEKAVGKRWAISFSIGEIRLDMSDKYIGGDKWKINLCRTQKSLIQF